MKNQLKITCAVALTLLFSVKVSGQWAGSSSGGEIQQSNNKKTGVADEKSSKFKFYVGYGIGGYTSSIVNSSEFIKTGNEIDVYNPKVTQGASFNIGLLKRTKSNPKLSAGIEFGGSAHFKEQVYTYSSSWSTTPSESTAYIDAAHFGLGMPLRYTFYDDKDVELYLQGVVGYGILYADSDEHFAYYETLSKGVFYGGGSIGVKFLALYGELGYNSTGFLRFGLAF